MRYAAPLFIDKSQEIKDVDFRKGRKGKDRFTPKYIIVVNNAT